MYVKFQADWFAPTEKEQVDRIRSVSGRRFRKGVQEVPDFLKEYLPKSAKVLDENYDPVADEVVEKEVPRLEEFDHDRAASDQLISAHEQAEAEVLKLKQERMAKARQAKAEKAKKKAGE
jgi:hypothetical protein